MRVADPQRDACGVEVLEPRLRIAARGAERVAQLGEGDPTAGHDERLDLRARVGVGVQALAEPQRPSGLPQRGEVGGIELGVRRRPVTGVAEPRLERQR